MYLFRSIHRWFFVCRYLGRYVFGVSNLPESIPSGCSDGIERQQKGSDMLTGIQLRSLKPQGKAYKIIDDLGFYATVAASGTYMTRVLDRAIRFRGLPTAIRTDQGRSSQERHLISRPIAMACSSSLSRRASRHRMPISRASMASSGMNA